MVDLQTVCCMCGDVGFPDKLFRCNKCRNRFQHSYCSNYYSEFSEPVELCDWCQSEERNARHGNSSKKSGAGHDGGIVVTKRSEYTGDHKIKQHDREENSTTSSDQREEPKWDSFSKAFYTQVQASQGCHVLEEKSVESTVPL